MYAAAASSTARSLDTRHTVLAATPGLVEPLKQSSGFASTGKLRRCGSSRLYFQLCLQAIEILVVRGKALVFPIPMQAVPPLSSQSKRNPAESTLVDMTASAYRGLLQSFPIWHYILMRIDERSGLLAKPG